MFRSYRLGSLVAAIAMAAVAVVDFTRDAMVSCVQAMKALALRFVDAIAPAADQLHRPRVAFVQAKAFLQRIIKRERPVMFSNWRMCPSV